MPGAAIRQRIQKFTGDWQKQTQLGGGDIAAVWHISASGGEFVLKTLRAAPAGLFASEARGLAALAAAGALTPAVIAHEDDYLLLEYLAPARVRQAEAGAMLARLHLVPQASYGAAEDTYLATIVQNNMRSDIWAEFFLRQRLFACLQSLAEAGGAELQKWQRFAEAITPLLNNVQPSLLHGDLWGGNLLYTVRGPALIDPACYCGDALVDLAMTQLFGGFDAEFYAAYHEVIPVRPNERELLAVYTLYPLLIHARLFGGSYYRRAAEVRDRFF